jgi:hypothetical protein
MSYPAPTTGLGVAAKILVAGNDYVGVPSGKQTVPGYNKVKLSLSGANGPTTFQINPEIVDASGTVVALGTKYAVASVAASTGGAGILVASAIAASSGGTAVITVASGGSANEWEGHSFVVAGFVNAANNGTFIATASSSTTLTVTNPNAVAETHAATATDQIGTAVYTGTFTGEATGSLVGKTFTVTGFVTNPTNNGTFIATANSGTTTLTLANPAAVSETNTAAAQEEPAEWNGIISSVATGTGVYTGTFTEHASYPVGAPVKITGFVTNAANNGLFYLVSATATTITTTNSASVSESASAIAAVNPFDVYTYFVDGTKNYNPTYATGPVPSGDTTEATFTVSSNGLLTAQALGGGVVEVSFPTFQNQIGDTGAIAPNPMAGLPLMKIYADVTVKVLA